jgi:hypothetical protein
VILRRGHVESMLRLHARVLADGGTPADAMWVILSTDRMARLPGSRFRARPAHDIMRAVSEHLQVGPRELRDSPRLRLRWVAFQLLRDDGWTVRAIARLFAVSPGTVLYGLDQLGEHPELVDAVTELRMNLFNAKEAA